jgi:hypothetical protein
VQKQYICVGFNGKVFIWCCEEYIVSNTQHLIDEVNLAIIIANVLNDCVTEHPIERFVRERKANAVVGDKLLARKYTTHFT